NGTSPPAWSGRRRFCTRKSTTTGRTAPASKSSGRPDPDCGACKSPRQPAGHRGQPLASAATSCWPLLRADGSLPQAGQRLAERDQVLAVVRLGAAVLPPPGEVPALAAPGLLQRVHVMDLAVGVVDQAIPARLQGQHVVKNAVDFEQPGGAVAKQRAG